MNMSIWHIDLDLARKALQAQKERRNDDIEAWAERLAKDICAAGEDPDPITKEMLERMVEYGKDLPDPVVPEDDSL